MVILIVVLALLIQIIPAMWLVARSVSLKTVCTYAQRDSTGNST